MGQQISQAGDESFRSIGVEKIKSARARKSFNPKTNVPLLSRFCCNVERRQVWKDTTIKQLQALSSSCKWAAPLAAFLQETNTEKQDEAYMADMISKIYENIETLEAPMSERSHKSVEESVSFTVTNPDLSLERVHVQPIRPWYEQGRRSSDHNVQTVFGTFEPVGANKSTFRSNSIHAPRKGTSESKLKKTIYLSPLDKIPSRGSLDLSPQGTQKKSENLRKAETTADNIKHNVTINESPYIFNQSLELDQVNYKQGKKKYKAIMRLLQKHLSQRNNIFNQMINKFADFMEQEYLEPIRNLTVEESTNLSRKISHDTELFIGKLYKSIDSFYQLDRLSTQKDKGYHLFFSRENVTTALLSPLFNEKLYAIHYQVYKVRYSKLEKSYMEAFNLIKNAEPQDFGVPEELALNHKTIEYFIQRGLLQPPRTLQFNETIIEADFLKKEDAHNAHSKDSVGSPMMREALGRFNKQSEICMVEGFKGRISELEEMKPYDKVIKKLETLSMVKSPSHKMRVLMDCYKEIENSIKEFYKKYGQSFEEKLTENQILPIFLFIIARCGISGISAHLKFIRTFLPKNILESTTGFYISVIEASISCICNTNLEESYNFKNLDQNYQDFFTKSIKRLAAMKQQPSTFDNIF